MQRTCLGLWLAIFGAFATFAADRVELGQPAPEWDVDNWMGSPPLKLSGLRGKVVLVRWWTAPGCRYCVNTAPALNEFHRVYAKAGLQVIGFYHHKSDDPVEPRQVERAANEFGFRFPVAIDPKWRTLNRWWLDHRDDGWSSVTFLIDRQGVVRHIHPGGEYIKGDPAYRELKEKIESLLESGDSAPKHSG